MDDAYELPAGTGQVASQIRWLVLSRQLETIGEVHPVYPTSITNDTSANIVRSLRGLTLRQNDMREINPNVDRLMPVWEFEDGSRRAGYTGWPCGVFMFGGRVRERGSLHTTHNATLMDQGYQLDQKASRSYGIPLRGEVYPRMLEVLRLAGINDFEIEPTDQRVKDPINWAIGTTWLQMFRDMCKLVGFYRPWFDNVGVARARTPQDLTDQDAHVYDLDTDTGRVSRLTPPRENDNLLSAPNVYVVTSNGPTQTEIVARSWIDPRLPHSVENIGYERAEPISMQGLEDTAHAQRIADSYAAQDAAQYLVVDFESAPNPSQDTFDAVRYDGTLYRELRSTLTLTPGGPHSHTCMRGPYDPEPF